MRRRGFTFVELVIGMAITALVISALSAVSYAVSITWREAAAVDSSYVTGTQVQARLSQYFRSAAELGAFRRGSLNGSSTEAAIFFWMGDANSNGSIQFNEIGLIYHDRTSKELRLYHASDWDTWGTTAQTAANAVASTSYIENTVNMADFMTACPTYRVFMRNVSGLVLNTVSTADRPLVEYVLQMEDRTGQVGTHYGTITVRAPVSASN